MAFKKGAAKVNHFFLHFRVLQYAVWETSQSESRFRMGIAWFHYSTDQHQGSFVILVGYFFYLLPESQFVICPSSLQPQFCHSPILFPSLHPFLLRLLCHSHLQLGCHKIPCYPKGNSKSDPLSNSLGSLSFCNRYLTQFISQLLSEKRKM